LGFIIVGNKGQLWGRTGVEEIRGFCGGRVIWWDIYGEVF
jgi:hypothetical protein